jgi:hypothetical protein
VFGSIFRREEERRGVKSLSKPISHSPYIGRFGVEGR